MPAENQDQVRYGKRLCSLLVMQFGRFQVLPCSALAKQALPCIQGIDSEGQEGCGGRESWKEEEGREAGRVE